MTRSAFLGVTVAVATAVVCVGAILWTGPAGAGTYSSAGRPLAVVAQSPGNEQAFYSDSSGDLIEMQSTNGSWGDPIQAPVTGLATGPTAVSANGTDYVFWEGVNGDLWEATTSGGTWTAAQDLGMGTLGSQPTAVTWTPFAGVTEIDVYWQGTGGQNLWQATWLSSTNAWTGPTSDGFGPLASAPTADAWAKSDGTTETDVYWENTGGGVEESVYTSGGSGGWAGPYNLGFQTLGSPPAAAVLPTDNNYVFWESNGGNTLYHGNYNGQWNGPTGDGIGPVGSAPSVVASSSTELDVFWESGGDLWEATRTNGTWTGVQSRGSLTPQPTTQTNPVTTTVPTPGGGGGGGGGGGSGSGSGGTSGGSGGGTKTGTLPQLRVKIVLSSTWVGARTRIHSFRLGATPADAAVRMTCTGTRCPRNLGTSKNRRELRRLEVRLGKDTFRAGDVLNIVISARKHRAERIELRMRNGAEPLSRVS